MTGSSDDIQIRLAATRCGVRLPQRMIVPLQPGKRYAAGQLDLMVHVGGDGARVHLAEYCAALRIPAKVVAAPTAVGSLIASGNWSLVQAMCSRRRLSCCINCPAILMAPVRWGRCSVWRVWALREWTGLTPVPLPPGRLSLSAGRVGGPWRR